MNNKEPVISCVEITLSINCTICGTVIPINGPYLKVQCSSCGSTLALKKDYGWHSLLLINPAKDVFMEIATNNKGKIDSTVFPSKRLSITHNWPLCDKCGYRFKRKYVTAALLRNSKIECVKCKHIIKVQSAPRKLSKPFSCALYIIGGVSDQVPNGIINPITISKEKHNVFYCSGCGANLEVTGLNRIVRCSSCEGQSFLPDDVWYSLKSNIRIQPWYIIFDQNKIRH